MAPSGRCTQSEGETLELFLITRFKNSEVSEEMAARFAALHVGYSEWRVAARVVTYRRVEWEIDSFAPYKSPGIDHVFLAMLQEGRRIVIPYLVRIFSACLLTGYVPAMWRQVKVVFIPEPSRYSRSRPRDFRLISPTLFLLKTMERLVDRYLRDEALALEPLHPFQHAYQTGKFVETTLHQLVVRVEKVLDQQGTALSVFLDRGGFFNNTSYDSMCDALVRHRDDYIIVGWFRATLEDCMVAATLNGSSTRVAVSRGAHRGGGGWCCCHFCGALWMI